MSNNSENDLNKFGHHHEPKLRLIISDENVSNPEDSQSKKTRVAGWLIITAATVGSGLSAWTVVESFQNNNDFLDPTPAKLAVSGALAGATLVGTIFSRKAE